MAAVAARNSSGCAVGHHRRRRRLGSPSDSESACSRALFIFIARGTGFQECHPAARCDLPDGTRLAYEANSRIYLRPIGEPEPREIQGTETEGGVHNPMFAPDGQSIAYFEVRSGALKRVPITGGTAATIASNVGLPCGGATWGPDDILIGLSPGLGSGETSRQGGIWRVRSGGTAPELIVGSGADEVACGPQMLPGGDTLLFTLAKVGEDNQWDEAQIVAYSLADGSRQVLIKGGSDARYLPTGHLLYAVAGTMYAVPFDAGRLVITGAAVPAVVGVGRSRLGATHQRHTPGRVRDRDAGVRSWLCYDLDDDVRISARGRRQRPYPAQGAARCLHLSQGILPTAGYSPLDEVRGAIPISGCTTWPGRPNSAG